jgi:steroid 5-alpha reductase family enzyme
MQQLQSFVRRVAGVLFDAGLPVMYGIRRVCVLSSGILGREVNYSWLIRRRKKNRFWVDLQWRFVSYIIRFRPSIVELKQTDGRTDVVIPVCVLLAVRCAKNAFFFQWLDSP